MASPRGPPERRDGLLHEIFDVLDQKQRGFVSKVELSHILDAMQADAGRHRLSIPEGLSPRKILRDCRVNLQDMTGFLEELTVADLEDVKWFAESVVKVETELRDLWVDALRRWQEDLLRLQSRELHQYLLNSQPKAVSRWLQLRDGAVGANSPGGGTASGLGFSLHEVETLFAANTAEEINSYQQQMEPFLQALDIRRQLEFGGSNDQVKVLLQQLSDLAESNRDLACLLIHEDSLGMACGFTKTAITVSEPSPPMSSEVILEASKLIMTLLSHSLHLNCEHPKCTAMLCSFLETDYDPDAVEAPVLSPLPRISSRDRCSLGSVGGRASILVAAAGPRKPQTISTWVENLVTTEYDLDRGDFVDKLIKYDEQRLRSEEVSESLFSHGRTIPLLLGRLNLSSPLSTHERRTPLRTHLLKFLLNILSSSGDRGRRLFRSAKGMQVLSTILRGDSWGEPLDEASQDFEETAELPPSEWQGVYDAKDLRYYPCDFVDDKFYGPKDRVLAAAFLEYLCSEELWGEDQLMEEVLASKGLLQVLCRVPSCQNLLRVILRHRRFGETLERSASMLAERFVEGQLRPLLSPSLPRLSVPFSFGGFSTPEHREALQAFHRAYMEAETKNSRMRILSFMYHHLQNAQGVDQEDVDELSRLLAAHLPPEVLPVAMAVFLAQEAGAAARTECLYLLRLVQLYQLRSTVPNFVVELEGRLRSLSQEAPSSEALSLTASLSSSLVKRFPRSTPCELVQSLITLLREFTEPVKATRQELQILAFSRLCFYLPPQKTSQDSAAALWAELGLSDRKLRKVQETLLQIPAQMLEAPFTDFSHPNCCMLHRDGYLSLLQLTLDEQMLAFIYCGGAWMLWANSLNTSALTECSKVPSYFGVA